MKGFFTISTIGKVFNIILFVLVIIGLTSFELFGAMISSELIREIGASGYTDGMQSVLMLFAFLFVGLLLGIIFSSVSRSKVKQNPAAASSYVMMIIAGIVSLNIFYIIAYIVGLASRKSAREGEQNNGRNNYGAYNDRPAGRGRDYDDRRGYDDRDRRGYDDRDRRDYDDRDRRGYDDRDRRGYDDRGRRGYDDRDRRGYDDRDRRDYDDRGRDYDRPARRYDDDEGGRRQDRPQKREKSPTFEFNYDDGAPENKEFYSFDEFGKNDK